MVVRSKLHECAKLIFFVIRSTSWFMFPSLTGWDIYYVLIKCIMLLSKKRVYLGQVRKVSEIRVFSVVSLIVKKSFFLDTKKQELRT